MDTLQFSLSSFLAQNKSATKEEIFSFLTKELDVDHHLQIVKKEVDESFKAQTELRPLINEKKGIEEKLRDLSWEMEVEVAAKYPPRQGSDKDREMLRAKLKKDNAQYQALDKQFRDLSEEIFNSELNLDDIRSRAKNARKILETFDSILNYISQIK